MQRLRFIDTILGDINNNNIHIMGWSIYLSQSTVIFLVIFKLILKLARKFSVSSKKTVSILFILFISIFSFHWINYHSKMKIIEEKLDYLVDNWTAYLSDGVSVNQKDFWLSMKGYPKGIHPNEQEYLSQINKLLPNNYKDFQIRILIPQTDKNYLFLWFNKSFFYSDIRLLKTSANTHIADYEHIIKILNERRRINRSFIACLEKGMGCILGINGRKLLAGDVVLKNNGTIAVILVSLNQHPG